MEIRELLTKLKKEPMRRTLTVDRAAMKTEDRSVPIAFSSELPYARWWGIEILDHSPGAMRLDRAKDGIAVLFNHARDAHLGIMGDVRCDPDKVGRGMARFGQGPMACEKMQDVSDGILKDVSVGYEIHFMQEMDPKTLPSELMEMAAREKLPVYRITDWEPYECSFVTVPADPTVGVGRTAASPGDKGNEEEVKPPTTIIREERTMPDPTKDQGELAQIEADLKKARETAGADASAKERARCEDIHKYWYKFRDVIQEFVRDKAIKEGWPIEQFRGIVLDRISDSKGSRPLDTPLGEIGLSHGDVQRYSILRAIRAVANKDWRDAGFEKECSDQVAKQVGAEARAFYLPYDILTAKRERRDMNVTTDTAGGFLVGTTFMPGSFIELLRSKLVAAAAGVQIMSGLVGNVAIPKETADPTGYWIETEGTAPTESQGTVGQVTLSPKNVAAWVDITRNLMKQSAPAADTIVLNSLVKVLARMIDLAVFHGTGANGQPTGIAGLAAGTFTGTTFSRILAVSALTDVMNANAEVPGMKWVCNPTSWGILKVREEGTAGYPSYLCKDDNTMLGFPVLTSTQITAANLFFGDFMQAVIGEWGVLDINVDDKSLSTSGGLRIVGYQSVDVAVRQTGAFTLATNLS
jgi:HK97 family phage major capsid protein